MIKQSKSGTTANQTEFKGNQYEINDQHKWTGQEIGVDSNIPLIDAGTGKPYIIRQFEFSFNPEMAKKIQDKKYPAPTKQELFNSNWRQIQVMLWGDGLVPYQGVEPRMIVGKKKYKIILLCEPRTGVVVANKPRTLQEITKPKMKNG